MKAKTVLITGSTSGIGFAIAAEFAKAGYNLVLHGLEPEGPEIAARMAREFPMRTAFSGADLLRPEEVTGLIQHGIRCFGAIDVLVNNAGIQHVAPLEEFPEEAWNRILGVNLTAAFLTCKAVWPGMKAAGGGRIIQIASVHGLVASPFKSAYVASKHGLLGLTKTLALEGAELGITVNAICPGYVKTPLVEKQVAAQARNHRIPEEQVVREILLAKQPVHEFVPAESIGALAVFLASDQARLITGAALPVDGGWTAA